MVPLNDDTPTRTLPYGVYGLIILNVLLFLYRKSLEAQGSDILGQFFQTWAIVPIELSGSFNGSSVNPMGEWFTLISSQFLHANWQHLGLNMLSLWIFGKAIEDKLGHCRFIGFYLVCGVLAGLSEWIFSQGSTIPLLGASGAISGVMGAYITRFPRAQILTLLPLFVLFTTVRIPAIFFLGFWFVIQTFSGIASLGVDTGGVAYWAHAGGFMFGVILGSPLLDWFYHQQGPFNKRNRRDRP